MAPYDYVLSLRFASLAVECVYNDRPAYRKDEPGQHTVEHLLNPWMLEGENTLSLRLGRMDAERAQHIPPDLQVFIERSPAGKEDEREELVRYHYWPEESPLPREGLTEVFSHRLSLRSAFGRWAYQDAQPYLPSHRVEIQELCNALHGAFTRRDAAMIETMLEVKTKEIGRACRHTQDEAARKLRLTLDRLFGALDWHVRPLAVEDLELEDSAGGRLVEVRRRDGKEVIWGAGGETSYALGLYVSRLGEAWRVVR